MTAADEMLSRSAERGTEPTAIDRHSRRSLLAAAAGSVLGLAAGIVGRPAAALAAPGDPLILGSTTNNAGTTNTTVTTSSAGTAFQVIQNGGGTAVRAKASAAGAIAGFFTSGLGPGISGVTGKDNQYGVYAANDATSFSNGVALRANGNKNHGLSVTTGGANATAISAYHWGPPSTQPAVFIDGNVHTALDAESKSAPAAKFKSPGVAVEVRSDADGTLGSLDGGTFAGVMVAANSQAAVSAWAKNTTNGGGFIGVYGRSDGANARGVVGYHMSDTGDAGSGVEGHSTSDSGVGVGGTGGYAGVTGDGAQVGVVGNGVTGVKGAANGNGNPVGYGLYGDAGVDANYAAYLAGRLGVTSHVELSAIADPTAAAASTVRLFAKDNGSGKMQLCVRFPTGAVQVLATEP